MNELENLSIAKPDIAACCVVAISKSGGLNGVICYCFNEKLGHQIANGLLTQMDGFGFTIVSKEQRPDLFQLKDSGI